MKNKNWVGLILVVLFHTQTLHAQLAKDSNIVIELRSFLKLKISLNCGLEYEYKINKTSSINFFGGVLLGPAIDGFSFSNIEAKWRIVPDTYAEYRNYYNLGRRNNHQKRTSNNSANFLFGRVETLFAVKNQNYFNLLFIQGWGAQRRVSRKINLDFHLGIIEHFYYDKPPKGGFNYIYIEPLVNFSFNYVF